ncbi:MAG: hypothetical protein AB7F43_04635 [Bacteriovoracia bacterium]
MKKLLLVLLVFSVVFSQIAFAKDTEDSNPEYTPEMATVIASGMLYHLNNLERELFKLNLTKACFEAGNLSASVDHWEGWINKGSSRSRPMTCTFKNCHEFEHFVSSALYIDNVEKPGYFIHPANFCENPSEYSSKALLEGVRGLISQFANYTDIRTFKE